MNKSANILTKKHEYNHISIDYPLNILLLSDKYEIIYKNELVTIVRDKEREDIFIYHTLKDCGVQVKYTPPVTIYRENTVVLYANEYGEKLKLGSYIKNVDNYHHIVSNGEKELTVSFVVHYRGNEEHLGKPLLCGIMDIKNRTDDKASYI